MKRANLDVHNGFGEWVMLDKLNHYDQSIN